MTKAMNDLLNALIEKNKKQKDALLELLQVLKEEKEALRETRSRELPELLARLQEVSGKAMLAEAERNTAAKGLADSLGCRPVIREISQALDPDDGGKLKNSSKDLLEAIISIKEVNFILSRQAEEHRFLADMVLERMRIFASNNTRSSCLDQKA